MPLQESMRKRSAVLVALAGYSVLPALGIACFRIPPWAMFRSEYGYLDGNVELISHFIQALTLVLFLVVERRLRYTESTLVRAAGVSVLATLLGTVLFCLAPLDIVYAYIGAAITGAVSTIPLLAWGYYLCSVNPCKSAFQLTLAFVFYGLATAMLSGLPASWAVVPMMLCPVLCFVCLWLSISRDDATVAAEAPFARGDLRRLPWGVLAVLFVCALSNTLAKVLVPTGDFASSTVARLYWPVIFTAVFIVFCLWIFGLRRSDPYRLWPIFAILIFSGLLCYTALSIPQPAFANTFFRATQDCVMLFCWVIAAATAYRKHVPAIPLFGLMTLVFVKSPLLVSSLVPWVPVGAPGASAVVVTAVTALTLVVLTVVISNLDALSRLKAGAPSARVSGEADGGAVAAMTGVAMPLPATAAAGGAPSLSAPEEAVGKMQAAFDLTQREVETALYLLNGYTMPQIADTLCVSIDTVRSHCKNLYRKTGIHKKQELVRLVEQLRVQE